MIRAVRGPALLGVVVLIVSGSVMGGLLFFKRAPAEASLEQEVKPIYVEVVTVAPEDVPVTISGYGQVSAKKTVTITPQVSGEVVEVHPLLLAGGVVPEGELLFALDPRAYASQVAEAQAQVQRQESARERLEAESRHKGADLKSLKRNGELARQHHARAKQLFDEGVGSQSAVDEAERALLTAQNEIDSLTRALSLYPLQLEELASDVASAQARLDRLRVDLEHTRVHAPFRARVKSATIEAGEVVAPGVAAVELVDDSVLEIAVPLNSRDARQWLRFAEREAADSTSWFGALAPTTCQIRWTEGEQSHFWEGSLHRVADYEQESRTLTVVVRVSGEQVLAPDRFPLVEGMFCTVEIPGRSMEGVYRLEPHVVSFENTVYLAVDGLLKTVSVEVVRIEEDYTYVSGGLKPGDQVITTRLVNPLDRYPVSIVDRLEATGS